MPVYIRIFLIGAPGVLKHLKNEIHTWKTRLAWILVVNLRRRSCVKKSPSCHPAQIFNAGKALALVQNRHSKEWPNVLQNSDIQKVPLHKMITEPNFIIFKSISVVPVLPPTELFLDLTSLFNHWEQWIAEPLGLPNRNVIGIVLVILVEELPKRNRSGINSVVNLCVILQKF